jgi:2-isopropylmalate synthase
MVCLCDTNGGNLPTDIEKAVKVVRKEFNIPVGIHTHNDGGLAVANSIAAVYSGCTLVQGTINGYGERCGNADLCIVVPNLELKMKKKTSIGIRGLKNVVSVSRFVSEIANAVPVNNQPFVGYSAFAHKGGIHINAVSKNPRTYEHIPPEYVGNQRRILVSDIGGRSAIAIKAAQKHPELQKDTPQTKEVLNRLQNLEHQGYQFEAADASFELLLRKALKKHARHFDLIGYRIIVEKDENSTIRSEAAIKIKVKGKMEHTAADGDGPVNALDNALRKALTGFFPVLSQMHLTDFKVRVLNPGAATAARVRVFIQSADDKDEWTTVGVSENIIEASWEALVDSIDYKLLKSRIKI